jgi:hypothetical protein
MPQDPTPPPLTVQDYLQQALGKAESIGPALTHRQMADAQMQAPGPMGDILRAVASGGFSGGLKLIGGGGLPTKPPARPRPNPTLASILSDPRLPDDAYANTVKTLSDTAIARELFRVQQPSLGLSALEKARRVEQLQQEAARRAATR